MCAQRQQVGEVDGDERRQDQIRTSAAGEGDHEPDSTEDERRSEPFPEPPDEGDRRDVIVFEAEPAVPCQSLDAKRLVPGLVAVHDDEGAGGQKGCNGQHGGHRPRDPPTVLDSVFTDRVDRILQDDPRLANIPQPVPHIPIKTPPQQVANRARRRCGKRVERNRQTEHVRQRMRDRLGVE